MGGDGDPRGRPGGRGRGGDREHVRDTAGGALLALAVTVKLARVVMLAPVVAALRLRDRRHAGDGRSGRRPPFVPLFVVGFVALALVRSTGVVPEVVVETGGLILPGRAARRSDVRPGSRRPVPDPGAHRAPPVRPRRAVDPGDQHDRTGRGAA